MCLQNTVLMKFSKAKTLPSIVCNMHKLSSCFFSVRLLSVLRGHSVFSSPSQRPMTSDFGDFLSQVYPLHFLS